MAINPESIVPKGLGFQKPSADQKKQAETIAAMIVERRARFDPYVGRKFRSKTPTPRPQDLTVVEFIPMLPMGAKGVRPAFRVARSPIPAAWFIDAEEFVNDTIEIVAEPAPTPAPAPDPEPAPAAPDAPAATTTEPAA